MENLESFQSKTETRPRLLISGLEITTNLEYYNTTCVHMCHKIRRHSSSTRGQMVVCLFFFTVNKAASFDFAAKWRNEK